MSFDTLPGVAPPPKLSIVGAFKAAPTLVKILAASFYLPALHMLVMAVVIAVGHAETTAATTDHSLDELASEVSGLITAIVLGLGLLFALIGFLLGKGIARGARGTWLLALVLSGLAAAVSIINLLDTVTVNSVLNVVIFVGTAALLLTPVVRQHCTKK